MAEIVTIEGNQYLRRNPLGVLGLTLITLGIYGLYWYYKINEEIKTFTRDETISPVRSLMAVPVSESLGQHLAQHAARVEVLGHQLARRPAVVLIVRGHGLDRGQRLFAIAIREEPASTRKEVAEAGVLDHDGPPAREIGRAAVAEPTAACDDVAVLRHAELAA